MSELSVKRRYYRIPAPWRPVSDWLSAVMGDEDGAAFLSDGRTNGRYSLICPKISEVARLDPADPGDFREALKTYIPRSGLENTSDKDGLIGWFSYEWGERLEPSLKRRAFEIQNEGPWPICVLWRPSCLILVDHHEKTIEIWGFYDDDDQFETARNHAEALKQKMAAVERHSPTSPISHGFEAEISPAAYQSGIAEIITRIEAGDLFQANLAQAYQGYLDATISPLEVAALFQATAPSPFGAYVKFGNRAFVSNSPERFIRMDPYGQILSSPIKGTAPRSPYSETDAQLATDLIHSAKDRAENLMIVDLMRHDLAKIAEPGSVVVNHLCALESFDNVHHLVSEIAAQLKPGLSAADVMIHTFPPGSITGAPKVQAMKTIAALEAPRGPYCGSLVWFGVDGSFDSNVLIRTLAFVKDGETWRFRAAAGGGIVADSDPLAEYQESETKLSLIRNLLTRRLP